MSKHGLMTVIGTSTYPGASVPLVSGAMGADIVGNATDVAGKSRAMFEFAWTDVGGAQNPVGQFSVEWSNEYHPQLNPNATFTTFTLSAADDALVAPATTSGRGGINLDGISCIWVRPRYTRTSGDGTAVCTVEVSE